MCVYSSLTEQSLPPPSVVGVRDLLQLARVDWVNSRSTVYNGRARQQHGPQKTPGGLEKHLSESVAACNFAV